MGEMPIDVSNATEGDAIVLTAVVVVIIALGLFALCRVLFSSRTMDCPECEGGSRQPPGPCPTCDGKMVINKGVGANPVPPTQNMGGEGRLRLHTAHKPRMRYVEHKGQRIKFWS